MKLKLMFAAACVAALAPVAGGAQEEQSPVVLSNGLTVRRLPPRAHGIVSAVLVCPLPRGADDALLADAALINRLLWMGGTALGRTVREHEYRMFALRFGGSISSQLLRDALIIQYTMPPELLPEVFIHMTVQWSGLNINEERLEALKTEVAVEDRSVLISTVENQLLREIHKRLLADLPYSAPPFGSAGSLESADVRRLLASFSLLRNPARWTLVIDGAEMTPELAEALESALGSIKGSDDEAAWDAPAARMTPMLGNALRLPADLERHHAVLAYRLPGAAQLDAPAVSLLVSMLRSSPQLAALRDDLSVEGAAAEVNIEADLRRSAGILHFSASWAGDTGADKVLERLRFVARYAGGEGEGSAAALATARKGLQIRYWTRFESPSAYALWTAQRAAVGLGEDRYIARLLELTAGDLNALSSAMLVPENSLTLVTAAP